MAPNLFFWEQLWRGGEKSRDLTEAELNKWKLKRKRLKSA